ncbi:hypothetical protein [Aquirufa ecclesiirivi]|uniref:Uncharacterized protein n=1 Tax=Aquirufa ecclesiirivi TaxID=2715124 RepID=A0ABT4JH79_9BACT|nr:hypothetical protein [Aquirufa ecclesiirivi]MCZ2473605.1 hypothetical protein [Aquirufa ecclesiirivi]MCZ2475640.1 hypothetical protein [Aquirufa ecclesiirivi]MDF0694465.1 hypothetical protein [Aquirufa ecclesiirivi]NHC48950.1 hypothetical protein [Aquirufa ecclesiirivi]
MSRAKSKKEDLIAQAEIYEKELSEEVGEIKQQIKEKGSQALLIGGVLLGSYLLYSLLSGSEKKSKLDTKEGSSFLGGAIKSYAIALALSLAKDKLVEFLQQLEENNQEVTNKK